MVNADHYITEVCYNKEHTHIEKVKSHPSNDINNNKIYTKSAVIKAIEDGIVIYTWYKHNDGNWGEGDQVRVVNTTRGKYIRTDSNSIAEDNLENLPEFC